VLAASAQNADSDADPGQLLQQGDALTDDLGDGSDIPKDGWLGLVPVKNHWELAPATLRLNRPDGDSGDILNVAAPNLPDAIVLLRYAPLRAGWVETPNLRFQGRDRPAGTKDKPLLIDFHGRTTSLVLTAGALVASSGGRRAVLQQFADPEGNGTRLLWAGDIDRDGVLDLLVEFDNDKNAQVCLFASGAARGKELLGKVGCQFYSG
jgi:hypothetical protein